MPTRGIVQDPAAAGGRERHQQARQRPPGDAPRKTPGDLLRRDGVRDAEESPVGQWKPAQGQLLARSRDAQRTHAEKANGSPRFVRQGGGRPRGSGVPRTRPPRPGADSARGASSRPCLPHPPPDRGYDRRPAQRCASNSHMGSQGSGYNMGRPDQAFHLAVVGGDHGPLGQPKTPPLLMIRIPPGGASVAKRPDSAPSRRRARAARAMDSRSSPVFRIPPTSRFEVVRVGDASGRRAGPRQPRMCVSTRRAHDLGGGVRAALLTLLKESPCPSRPRS